mmetsp:Transcript_24917/g.33028  ORF Transcript_24917/g.33028 Transcript_24917/m.33028 type:complete len:251 (-) Transcript_24917:1299-2051(-)
MFSFVRLLLVSSVIIIMANASASCLATTARYAVKQSSPSLKSPFTLVISQGSVVDFSYPPNKNKSAIVNAANEGCLGGGGVDGAITDAGGPNLAKDRLSLPIETSEKGWGNVRCKTGDAKITGPNSYGSLHVPFVIHAVGPNYRAYDSPDEGDSLLSSAYKASLDRAKEAKLEAVAFSLLSAGIFRGSKSRKDVLQIGMQAIFDFESYDELKEVHVCGFSEAEVDALVEIANEMRLPEEGTTLETQCTIL